MGLTSSTSSPPKSSPRRLLTDLLHDRLMRAGGHRLGELARPGGEGALQGVVLVLDLLQLEMLPRGSCLEPERQTLGNENTPKIQSRDSTRSL